MQGAKGRASISASWYQMQQQHATTTTTTSNQIYIYVAIEQKVIKSKIKANVANRRRKMQREFGQSCL